MTPLAIARRTRIPGRARIRGRQAGAARPAADRAEPPAAGRGRRRRGRDRPAPAGLASRTPRGHRGGVRLDRDRARHRPAARRAGRRRQAGAPAGACCPTSTWTGRRTPGRARWRRPGWACSSRSGPRLGVDAVATADVVLVPGLAVSPDGVRLGRGGGCYDRALGAGAGRHLHLRAALRRRGRAWTVPVEPHDRPVLAAASPAGITASGAGFRVSVSSAGVLDRLWPRTPTAASRPRPRGRSGRCSGR